VREQRSAHQRRHGQRQGRREAIFVNDYYFYLLDSDWRGRSSRRAA